MDEVEGLPTELIDRLVGIIDSDDMWNDLGELTILTLGGQRLRGIMADTGRDYPPGSVGAERAAHSEMLSRNAYFGRIRDRLAELVLSGLNEAFLVRSVRDELRRYLAGFADTQSSEATRAQMRADLERMAEDPAEIAGFRATMTKHDPSAADLSDEEVAENLRSMAVRLEPITVEAELDRVAALDRWDRAVADRLSDTVIEYWIHQYANRMLGR